MDVLDPGLRAGDRHPQPGGLTSGELLWAVRTVAAGVELIGADVVEVCPTAIGTADPTALVAERTVREIMTGVALRKREGGSGSEPTQCRAPLGMELVALSHKPPGRIGPAAP